MRDFVMGARLQLTDAFTRPLAGMNQAVNAFRSAVARADDSVTHWRDTNGRLRDELGRFVREAERSENALERNAAAATNFRDRLVSLKSALVAIGSSMAAMTGYKWLIDSNAQMEQYQNTLTVVLGSQEKALQTLQWAQKFAAETPFEIPQIVEATTRLSAYGLEAQKVLGITGDMAAVMGKDLMQAVEAVADAQTGELERLKEFGITKKMIEAQAKLMGTSPVNKQGQITDQEAFNKALFALMEKRFKGGMEMQAKTFKGMLSNAADFIGTMGRKLGAPIFDKLKNQLQGLLDWLNNLQSSGALDKFITGIQDGFAKVGRFIRGVTGYIGYQIDKLYQDHKPTFDLLKRTFQQVFSFLQSNSGPVLYWMQYKAIPGVIKVLSTMADWILKASDYVITHWDDIVTTVQNVVDWFNRNADAITWTASVIMTILAPSLIRMGVLLTVNGVRSLASMAAGFYRTAASAIFFAVTLTTRAIVAGALWIAQGWYTIYLLGVMGVQWLVAAARAAAFAAGQLALRAALVIAVATTWLMTAAQWALNAAFWANPITWVVALIVGLIAAGVLLWKNWDTIVAKAKVLWDGIKTIWNQLTSWVTGKIHEAFTWGENIIKTMADGILAAKDWIVNKVKSVFEEVRKYMPFSDAKKGPFSQLTYSGGAIMTTLATGVDRNAGALHSSVANAFGNTPMSPTAASYGGKAPAGGAAPAAPGHSLSKSVSIQKLAEQVVIQGASTDDPKAFAVKMLEEFYQLLKDADDIVSTGDMGALLNG
jgi:hypothetical protein